MFGNRILVKLMFITLISIALVVPANANLLNHKTSDKYIVTTGMVDPPSSFDLRDVNGENYVTGIRNQGPYGTCWTFGTMASVEGNLLMTGVWEDAGETGEPDLSERHLDWWNGFNTHNNDDDPGGGGLTPHNGGDFRVSSSYMIRGEGAIREIDAPYTQIDIPPERTNPNYHYYYPRNVEWYIAGENLENIDTIKNKLMTNGVLSTALHASYISNMGSYYAAYQPPTSPDDPNHGVAIVGWDDDKVTPAPQPGAWLCKNSWGNWGPENGYFWISYYDKVCGQDPEMGAVSFYDIEFEPFENIYYHDYHGWRDTITDISEVFNAFETSGDETIVAISFFTSEDNVDYEAIIYDDYISGQLQNELSSKTGNIEHYGYHTIDLNNPISIDAGEDFYIYVSLSSGGHPIDRTSDVPVLLGSSQRVIVESNANPGESYYKIGSIWYDLFDYEFTNPSWDESANFCIKGLSGEYIPREPDLHCEKTELNWDDIDPGTEVTGDFTIENIGDPYSLLDWEIIMWPEWGEWNFNPISGINLLPNDEPVTIEVTVTAPENGSQVFHGEIKVVNTENSSDYEIISVTLITVRNKAFKTNLIGLLFNRFPLLKQIFEFQFIFS